MKNARNKDRKGDTELPKKAIKMKKVIRMKYREIKKLKINYIQFVLLFYT
jgi:hypothetical protein